MWEWAYECSVCRDLKKALGPPEAGVTGSCALATTGAGNQTRVVCVSHIHSELLDHFCRAEHIKFKSNFDEKPTLSKYLTLIFAKVSLFLSVFFCSAGIKPRLCARQGKHSPAKPHPALLWLDSVHTIGSRMWTQNLGWARTGAWHLQCRHKAGPPAGLQQVAPKRAGDLRLQGVRSGVN